ncbi:MAG: hypothetical protein M5U07_07555 [Xanthobacteraceae bacterium]|nr:hypothetical protein [Xanthobacteraceae bacterium]
MKRRINSTGRKPIGRDLISIRLIEPDSPNEPRSFTANLENLSSIGVPPQARIYIEPYVTGSSSVMRFAFGTVGAPVTPADTSLADLDQGGRILFRIRVVDESADVGKILAAANALRPVDEKIAEDQKRAILPVASDNLEELVWELDFRDTARPQLVLNNRVPGLMDRIKTDPLLQGAIVPAAVRQILEHVLDAGKGQYDDDLDWVQDWKRWASNVLGRDVDEEKSDPDEIQALVDEIIRAFAEGVRFVSKADLRGRAEDGAGDD